MIKQLYATVTVLSLMSAPVFSENGNGSSHSPRGGNGHGGAHWSYDGNSSPNYWGNLGYSLCGEGKNQSPVDISKSASIDMDDIEFHYSSSFVDMVDNGHTVQFNYAPGSSITVGGKRYNLAQFHFHSPSENTVSGEAFPMEMHLVHKSDDGRLAVVGVFFKERKRGHNSDSPSLKTVFDAMAGQPVGKQRVRANDLLPADHNYYHFMGSLTTPPCSEGVAWFVMQEPVEIDSKQLAVFQSLYDHNARPTQPWNKRIVYASGASGSGH